ncbi:hypothetical protein [Luteimonas terricola]|uniref:DUF2809 domain-containing protein n=1 Tax=Luteimonas terricola TaxID=645597 RepID=A0ABQ2E869_9GAMM|nr:hypothetical protein [Luteimonas terricola]GGK00486.1 hypothetical protein GCM10011394_07200 [Luteimonas terricola]
MPPFRFRPSTALALALAGSIGIAAAWILVAQATRGQGSWMAVVAALDAALLLRMGGFRPGVARAACGVLATALAIALANWGIAANEVGRMLGLAPWASMGKLGVEHAWLLVRLANDAIDLAWLAAGLVVAAVCSR